MICVKVRENVVACCGAELVGKVFEEGKLFLDVSKRFYFIVNTPLLCGGNRN